ncbi:restriction endonuclease [Tissierella sp. Yu-01]|uniref:restriction endonuclease n=1 Tax=Tissierella sp. Yu-01 TaxID=3035694 RepID=UPI00240E140A|nr:restriction endonuclease [Tissierella sp. Yu-01]WFA09615.1 restriction endonuclease [Tissierella sp. Yu-01]
MERFENLKERYQKYKNDSIVKNYYSKEIYKGKTYKAVNFDKIAIVILMFIILTTLFASFTNSIILPIYISLLLVFIITRGLISIRDKRIDSKIQNINEELKSSRVMRELSQMNREEFINYSKELLEKYYLNEFVLGEDGIDLIGNIRNKTYAVKCIKSTLEDKIIRKKVDEFHNYINYLGYDEGIIITNSYFQDEIKENTSLILFDFTGLKDILKSIKEYPTDEEIRNYIKYRHDDKKKNFQEQFKTFNLRKISKLYGISVILYIISYFVSYTLYYRIVAVLTFIVATIIGCIKITEYIRLTNKTYLHK